MSAPILATKLYIPSHRTELVLRARLVERLNAGLRAGHKLIILSASAGFGKTTLLSEWIYQKNQPFRVAWLSLDSADGDLSRFLAYLLAALQTVDANLGTEAALSLAAPQPPPVETILTNLLNDIGAAPQPLILALDDYHSLDSPDVDKALAFLAEHLPASMRLVIASREDPPLPLARLRARNQVTELRAADLRFTPAEAAEFLNRVMGLTLTPEHVASLEARTEGWIAGLQLAALAMQGQPDITGFIQSFTGSHRFVLDYLLEEVLRHQPQEIQSFLLRTSILERVCAPLCDAVTGNLSPDGASSHLLESIERANLFLIPLDNERRWYRYHHLFADFLRQRLQSSEAQQISQYHVRASQWLEANGLEFEAFRHAVAANDIERAERLTETPGMPRHFRSVANSIIHWLDGLPKAVKDARPSLWIRQAGISLVAGQTNGVAEWLQAAEKSLESQPQTPQARHLHGRIATARSTLALTQYRADEIFAQARRALQDLAPEDLGFRFTAHWTMGFAHYLQGNRGAALEAYQQALAIARAHGEIFSILLAVSGLGHIQELETHLHEAAETYEIMLPQAREHPIPAFTDIYLGLARIHYEWNNLPLALEYAEKSLRLALQYDKSVDRYLLSEVLLARVKLAQGDAAGAAELLARAQQAAPQPGFAQRLPEVIAGLVLALLQRGDVTAAAQFAELHPLPLCRAHVLLAQGQPQAALPLLTGLLEHTQARGWRDETLRVLVAQSLSLRALGEKAAALEALTQALTLAAPGGFLRLFVDEGEPMKWLIADFRLRIENRASPLLAYTDKLLAWFPSTANGNQKSEMRESLTDRELDVLRLIAQGLSNGEISAKRHLALSTVKGYNQKIFDKLQAENRTEAVAKARELGLL